MRYPPRLLVVLVLTASLPAGAVEKRPAWTTSKINGTPEPPAPYRLVSAFPKVIFERPTSIEDIPEQNRLLVSEMGGKIYTIEKGAATTEKDLVVDLSMLLPKDLAARGVSLFDAELHPKFVENRHIYACYVYPGDGRHTRVSRLTLTAGSPPHLVPNSEQVVITWPAGGHNGGCLEFGKDGYLYIATGDGSGPNPPDGLTTGQDVSDLLGSILRIDVDHRQGELAYKIPVDNPFVDTTGARAEIWAYGLRNPFKFGMDLKTGDAFAADNGWESWEMVHRIVRGGNCGWPIMEGRAVLRSEVKPGPTPILPPVKDHPHTEANSVIGGPVYRGSKLPDLAGSFVYGDYITGTIWAVKRNDDESYSFTTLCDTDQRIVAFTEGTRGELFVLDYDFTGQIYELVPSGLKDTTATFPRRLSETGLFASLEKLEPAPGVVPYSVTAERWVDGAQAARFVAIPGTGQMELSASKESPAVYPEGTVLVKQLSLPQGDRAPIRLETQLLHYEAGTWRPYSYLWDEAGPEAWLVESIGKSRTLSVVSPVDKDKQIERTWKVSAVNECKLCHNAESRYVLGFVLHQLNRERQLTELADQGVIAKAPALAGDDPGRLVNPHDATQKLDDRARSYLHANCGMCHQPGGNAIVSFFLRRDLPFEKLNTNKGTGIGTFGMREAKLIVPGDPYRSVLMYRMSKLGYARMPYIGSHLVDGAGVALIEEWIRSLPGPAAGTPSGPITPDSLEDKALKALLAKGRAAATRDAVFELMGTTEGALALIGQLHRGVLPPNETLAAAQRGAKSPSTDIRGLFDTFLPESQRRATLGPSIDPQPILSLKGDVNRGKLIYFSDGARCRACHEASDRVASLGPTLQEINKKYPKAEELLQHVLQPSLKIEEPLAAWSLVTNDGRTFSGLLVELTRAEVAVKTLEKKVVRLKRAEVEEMKKSPMSLMPDLLLGDLTAQEAADLVEYVQSLGDGK